MAAGGEPVELEEWTVLGPPNDGGERQPLAVDYRQVNPQFELPEGAYLVRARLGSAGKEREVRVRTGEITTVMFNLEAGTLSLSAVLSAGQDPFSVHEWKILGPPDPLGDRASVEVGHSQTRPRFTLPEGRYLVQAVQGAAQAELEVAVRAGEDTVTQLDFRAGTLSLTAVRGSDQEPLRVSRWRIFQMPDLFGKRRRVATEYSQANPLFTLPEGDYWVLATHEESTVEQKVTVRAGEAAQVRLRLIDPD